MKAATPTGWHQPGCIIPDGIKEEEEDDRSRRSGVGGVGGVEEE